MKISELTEEQNELIADNLPEWMAENRPEFTTELPEEIMKLLGQAQ